MLYREGEGIIDPSWEELSGLLDHPAITGFGSLRQQDDVPAAEFVSAFDMTASLPLLLVIGEEGLLYTSKDLGQILNYVDGHTLDRQKEIDLP
ncbi:hypothetical protein [Halalkalibacter oceani]|uniref:hypothetical protein n=1 Tax=Halalkalibacter oceani TaxID=1653776 RepID=UPI00339B106A